MLQKFLTNLSDHPKGFRYIFFGEFAERAAYYGMRAIFALFLLDVMGFQESRSGTTTSFFTATCYLTCFFGGWISDKLLGKFWTIIVFAVPYLIAYPLLATASHGNELPMYIGMILLAVGSGVIKPNVSPLMGAMYNGKPQELKDQAFTWFYASINIGAAITSLLVPWIRTHYGFSTAFMSTMVVMLIALVIFFLGKKHYPKEEMMLKMKVVENKKYDYEQARINKRKFWRVMGVFLMISFFFMIFEQSATTWVFFAKDHLKLYGMDPDQLQAFNPILIVIFSLFIHHFWKFIKIEMAIKKMKIGFFVTACCMAIMACAGYLSDAGKVSSIWMGAAYVAITFAEIGVSAVAIQFAFEEAPENQKARMTSYLMLAVSLGNFLAGLLAQVYKQMSPGNYFGMLTLVMLVVAVIFLLVARNFESKKEIVISEDELLSPI